MPLEEKLQRIQSIVNDSVKRKKIDEVNKIEDELEKEREETKRLSEENYRKLLADAEKKNNSELTKAVLEMKTEMKKNVLKLREEIKRETFSKVLEKIKEFKSSDEYFDCLVKKTEECLKSLGDGEKIIEIDKTDENFKEKLQRKFDIPTRISEDDILGGVVVKKGGMLCDNSFAEALLNAEEEFLKNSGLNFKQ